jgi:hypothetical protein
MHPQLPDARFAPDNRGLRTPNAAARTPAWELR